MAPSFRLTAALTGAARSFRPVGAEGAAATAADEAARDRRAEYDAGGAAGERGVPAYRRYRALLLESQTLVPTLTVRTDLLFGGITRQIRIGCIAS